MSIVYFSTIGLDELNNFFHGSGNMAEPGRAMLAVKLEIIFELRQANFR